MEATIVFLLHVAFLSALHLQLLQLAAACPNLPSMSADDACRVAMAGAQPVMADLCKDTMRDLSYPSSSVDMYALVATKRAKASIDDSAREASELLQYGGASLTGDEKDAYGLCARAYAVAGGLMYSIADALDLCRFVDLGEIYKDSIAQLDTCGYRLMKLHSSPLYAMTMADRNKTRLAYLIAGKLLGVK